MKHLFTFMLAVGLLFVNGCGKTPAERDAVNQYNAANPRKITTMPDGRILYRIMVDNPDYDHYVYFFSTNDTNTITINHTVPAGKFNRIQTIVLDGQEFNLVPVKRD